MNQYDLYVNGCYYKVNASVFKIAGTQSNLECEVDLIQIEKFDEFLEEYVNHDPTEEELTILENQVAAKFFNSLN